MVPVTLRDPDLMDYRLQVHASLVRQMDLRRVDVHSMSDDELRAKTSEMIEEIIECSGRLEESPVVFTSDKAVLAAIERIVTPLGRRIDSSPMVDARLKDGSRVNAVISPVPVALRGPSISIP